MLYAVRNLDTKQTFYFQAQTPYESMIKLKYYLALKDKEAEKSIIQKTESGNFLYLVYKDQTYTVKMNEYDKSKEGD